MKQKEKKYLIWGIIGGILTMIGNLGTSAFLNGLGCSNMSLGGIIIFITWLCFMQKEGEKNDSI